MLRSKECTSIDNPEFSQTICTVLQIALVNLLRSFGIRPHAVVGHSSGEIASAYAAGFLSAESAYKLAYLRGLCSAEVVARSRTLSSSTVRGAMMSVALGRDDIQVLISSLSNDSRAFGLTVACENSPRNVTVAGEDSLIERLKVLLDEKHVFARRLNVPVAYHSHQMEECAAKYASMVGDLHGPIQSFGQKQVCMVSSVTGCCADASELLSPSYWSQNMVAPVQFSQALSAICSKSPSENGVGVYDGAPAVNLLIELGPHSTLQVPIREILADRDENESITYSSILKRGQSAHATTLQLVGQLFCRGVGVDLVKVNEFAKAPAAPAGPGPNLLVDLPEYPFNHAKGYWHESRISRNFRLRQKTPSEFLGVRSDHWSRAEPRWRQFIRTSEIPWVLDHVIDGNVLYPAAGMLVMAIEAIREMTEGVNHVEGYSIQDVDLLSAMDLTANKGCIEVETTLRARHDPHGSSSLHCYDFSIKSFNALKNDWTLNCRGIVAAE
ncbi:FabD/lysophospholipase-like protein, partial [Cryphonectria parasitica EP155]